MKRVAPMPAVPSIRSAPASPADADCSSDASLRERVLPPDEPRARVPGGHGGHSRGAPSAAVTHDHRLRPARLRCRGCDRRPPRAPSRQRRSTSCPGEEWLYFTKSVLTTAYPSELGHAAAQGPRRQQAAAAHGPPHRVLQPDRRARPRPVRRRRRDAARRGHRARPAARPRHRARSALGRGLRAGRGGARSPSATARGRCSPTSGTADPGGPRPFDPSGPRAAPRRRAGAPADARRRARSTSSRPTRRTTSSCR